MEKYHLQLFYWRLLHILVEPVIDENELNQMGEDRDGNKLKKEMELDDVILREFNFCFSTSVINEKCKGNLRLMGVFSFNGLFSVF